MSHKQELQYNQHTYQSLPAFPAVDTVFARSLSLQEIKVILRWQE